MLDYNVPKGKLVRGMTVYDVLSSMNLNKVPDRLPFVLTTLFQNLDMEDIRRANILGWCIEWLQAFFLVADDVMDSSITRRGQPCWYKQPDVTFPMRFRRDFCVSR